MLKKILRKKPSIELLQIFISVSNCGVYSTVFATVNVNPPPFQQCIRTHIVEEGSVMGDCYADVEMKTPGRG